MKRALHLLIVLTASCCLVFSLVGCGNEPIENTNSNSKSYSDASAGKMNCVVIYSNHANSQASTSGVEQYVRGTKEANGYLGFVRLDGDPVVTYKEQTATEQNNDTNIKRENDKFVSEKMGELEAIDAKKDEVDLLSAISEVDKCLEQAADQSLNNVIVIVGTGLSTTGTIDFASTGLTNVDLANYESWVEKSGQLPKLDNVSKIVWFGFDSTAEPQEEFPTEDLCDKLKNFYETLFKAAGVGNIEFKDAVKEDASSSPNGTKAESADLPKVSLVDMPAKTKYGAGDVAEISADILFNPDEATFLAGTDPKNDEQVIAIANSIKSSNLKVVITGYTAHYNTSQECEALSLARAEALKGVLVEMGCPAEKISTVGGGWGPYGEGSNEIDQKNRCVQFEFE